MRYLIPLHLTLFAGLLLSSQAQLTISEVIAIAVADERGNEPEEFQDEDGDVSDIIEIHNAGAESLSLSGYTMTDNENNLKKWSFSSNQKIEAGEYLLVYASGKNKTGLFVSTPHTNFTLNRRGEYLALVDPQGEVIDAFDPLPKMFDQVSYGHDGYMTRPTLGEANSRTLGVPSTGVKFETKSQTFTDPIRVELSAPNLPEGAYIGYTTNRSVPEVSLFTPPKRYEGPITIESTTQIRARVFEAGKLPSEVETATYIKVTDELKDWSSNLPVIVLDNDGERLPTKTRYIPTSWMILEPQATAEGGEKRTSIAQAAAMHTRAGMRTRGSSTAGNAKRSLALEAWFDDANWADKDINPLGLPADSDWVLSGRMQFDRALMRNPFMYEMFRQMGRWAPRTRFVEVYMNIDGDDLDEGDYFGVYTFMEKIKISDDRVQIEEADTGDDGGYIVKVDRTSGAGGDKSFSAGGDTFVWVEPQGSAVTNQQNSGLRGYMNDAIDAMTGDDPENPETGYRAFIDTGSWIDEYLARTLTRDPDGLRLSTYLYQPINGKLFYSPIWDFDRTMGCDSDTRARDPKAWVSYFATQGMWKNLLGTGVNRKGGEAKMPEFWQEWIDRYHELRRTVWSEENMHSIIDSMAAEIREGQVRNFERWSSTRPPGDRSGVEFNGGDDTWEGEVVHLKGWLSARVDWMDDQFVTQPSIENPGNIASGASVVVRDGGTLFSPQEAWYTINGSDPRLPGGEVSPTAIMAGKNITPAESVNIIMRAKRDDQWSGPIKTAIVVDGELATSENLLVTEIMYHPRDGQISEEAVGFFHEDLFEFIELTNVSDTPVSLEGVAFTDGITFNFQESNQQMLAPGERLVIVSDDQAFAARYGADTPIAGEFVGQLSNAGEKLTLQRGEELLHEFAYNDRAPWPETPDQFGFSLALSSAKAGTDLSDPSQWTVDTSTRGGSPGSVGATPPAVVVNEILANSGAEASDAIELYNASASEVDISGWWLSDSTNQPQKFSIPAGTVLPAGGYVVFRQDNDNDPDNNSDLPAEFFGNAFGLSSTGDGAYVFSATAAGELTGYQDGFGFGDTDVGATVGRFENTDQAIHDVIQSQPSLGSANAGPAIGPVVITEIMYEPSTGSGEYVELQNVSGAEVPLFEAADTWRLSGIDFDFPAETTLGAGETILVVGSDPTVFRAGYGVAESVRIFGPFAGRLDNNGESLRLQRPYVRIDENGDPDTRYYTAEEVDYDDESPWPADAAKGNVSIERLELNIYADQSTNWQSVSGGTPGVYAAPEPGEDLTAWLASTFTAAEQADAAVSGLSADPDEDGFNNLAEYAFGTDPKAASSVQLEAGRASNMATVSYRRRAGADAHYVLEASVDLKAWSTVNGQESTTPEGAMLEQVTVSDAQAISQGARFLRLRVTAK